ncbi:carbon-nitrogen hydrolase family protein [Prosthecobacter sp.]|uniref:carbon-nitrogen hydrolase family protein n=1 Tax=Prosthecobacter sp. TaxID=1965333 RepID=UPI002ABB7D0C|nr:carbon-nitrogen hydrolase family protein [Prosthecobacter sp.]MDZ4404257.1 carbon-nitrogen hydrolase family protein [Prosthecobacter sp.]
MPFKLALAQMPVIGGRVEENLRCASQSIAQAAAAGAAIVLLPEALDCGWCHSSALAAAGSIPDGNACLRLREAAKSHHIHVCAGLIERADDQLFNSAVLISPEGEVLLHHRKLNELAMAHHLYACGDCLAVAHTPLGTLGLMICADGFAPGQSISRALGMMGAQIILSPCAWAVPPDHDNVKEPYGQLWLDHYGVVAKEFGLWIAGASNVGLVSEGEWSGHKCIGCSLVMAPDGKPALSGPYGVDADGLLLVDIELSAQPLRGDGSCTAQVRELA